MAEQPIIDVVAIERDPPCELPPPIAPGFDPLALLDAQRELLTRSMRELERSLATVLRSLQRSFGAPHDPTDQDPDRHV